jgi:hypothetical protein
LRGIVIGGLREDRGDIGAGVAVLLEPGIDLALGGFTLARCSAVDEQLEDTLESLHGGGLRHQRSPRDTVDVVLSSEILAIGSLDGLGWPARR